MASPGVPVEITRRMSTFRGASRQTGGGSSASRATLLRPAGGARPLQSLAGARAARRRRHRRGDARGARVGLTEMTNDQASRTKKSMTRTLGPWDLVIGHFPFGVLGG